MKTHWTDKLVSLRTCEEALIWARTQPSIQVAWDKCERHDWMLWLLTTLKSPHLRPIARDIALLAIDYAESIVDLITDPHAQTATILSLHIARECAEGREDSDTSYAARAASAVSAVSDAIRDIIRKHVPTLAL